MRGARRPNAGIGRRAGFSGARPFTGLSLLSGGTFTRASEGSYLTGAPTDGSSAFLAWAANDVRRVENRGDGLGAMLLMEGSRTNACKRSRDITDVTAWAASATVGTITVTDNAGNGPDGAAEAARVTAAAAASTRAQAFAALMLNPHAVTAYGRLATGTPDWRPTYSGAFAWSGVIGAPWVRKEVVVASTGSTLYPVDTSTGGGAADLYVDLFQVENGNFPSSPIRTAAATATRAQDLLQYPVGQYPASFLTRGYRITFVPDFSSAECVAGNFAAGLVHPYTSGLVDAVYLSLSGGNAIVAVRANATGQFYVVTYARGAVCSVTIEPNANRITLAGFATGNGVFTHGSGPWTMGSGPLFVGNFQDLSSPFFGRISPTIVGL